MRRSSFVSMIALGTASLAVTLAVRAFARDGMQGMGMGGMMSPANRGPMRTGMQLFRVHANVRRTVSEIPGGIRAVSESDDPATAALLKTHVSEMYARLAADRPFPYPMSRAVPALFANSRSYNRTLTLLPRGIAVTETSHDPSMVAIIRDHAREIDGFVKDGMSGMMRGGAMGG